MAKTKTHGPPGSSRWVVWMLLIINAIPLIALNPWWHKRPGETNSEINALLLASLLFVIIPIILITVPIARYGKRHSWGRLQYSWVEPIGGIGWFVVLMWLAWRARLPWMQMDRVLLFAAMLGVPYALLLIGQARALKLKSPLHLGWVVAAVGTFALLLWVAGHT